ncbi:MAG: cob(I)yrinic acid a,c-diamide adenosyltransferase [Pseudomonadales bacterium]
MLAYMAEALMRVFVRMVHLDKIYTKSGDTGKTSLGDGKRVSKTEPRIRAYGGTDELNALLGVVLTSKLPEELLKQLQAIQNDLFDVGADLSVPETVQPAERQPLRVTASQVAQLEEWIDAANEHLQPLTSFILPGGTLAAATLHHARTVCRRVEIEVIQLAEQEPVNPQVIIYLNRLSDLLFVLARLMNNHGRDDTLWVPGGKSR